MNAEIISRFLAACAADPALQDFAKNRSLSVLYRLKDIDLDFYTVFAAGEVKTGMGTTPSAPDLTLKLTADVFDGMMTGRINAMTAAMSGKINFTGDTMKAMPAQKIQKDLMRLYTQARSEVAA